MIRFVIATMLMVTFGSLSPVPAQSFRAGTSTSNITPEIGRDVIGGFVPFPSTNVHDDLHARCLVLDDGESKVALVICDLLGIDRVISTKAREIIQQRHEIAPSHVMISATHTHSAASALGSDSRQLDQQPDEYQQFVIKRIADGVTRAIHDLRPAELAYGFVDIPDHVFNRRWHMRPGTVPTNPFGGVDRVKMNPPRGNANLVEPAGPIDPRVSFLSVREVDGGLISVFAAYSLHYVGNVGRGQVSADYFAVFSEHLKDRLEQAEQTSSNFVAMMANGTSGDINNINFRNPRPRMQPYEQINKVGRDVANKVHKAMNELQYQRAPKLSAQYREPTIKWRVVDDETQAWAKETLAAGKKTERDLSYIYAQRTMRQAEYPATTTVPLQVLKVGDVCIGTMPFEVFCEIGLEFRARSAIKPAFMVELAHGYYGYLPTPGQHRLGGYETWLGTNRVETNASTKLLSELLEMADQLK